MFGNRSLRGLAKCISEPVTPFFRLGGVWKLPARGSGARAKHERRGVQRQARTFCFEQLEARHLLTGDVLAVFGPEIEVGSVSSFFHTRGAEIVSDATGLGQVFRGLNLTGLEYGGFFDRPYPGELGTNYFMPRAEDFDAVQQRGFNLVRVPFEWARLVPGWTPDDPLPSTLEADYLGLLDEMVTMATERDLYVVFEMHDFLKYWDGQNSEQPVNDSPAHQQLLARTWQLLARHFANDPAVLGYDIMNEPQRWADPEQTVPGSSNWHAISNAVVHAIREENLHHLIFVEGPNYSLASRWPVENPEPWITDVVDPPRIVYSPHVYFDYAETSLYEGPGESEGPLAGWEYYVRDRLMPAINWSLEHEVPLFIGEVGVPSTAEWAEVMDYAFAHFFEPLQLSVAVWHYIDPQYNATDPMNLALPAGTILLDTLAQYPGGTTTDAGTFRYLPEDSRIYTDHRVNPWHHDGSWGDVLTDDSATDQVWAGEHSLSVVFGGNGGGLKFNHQYGLDTSVFDTLAFSLYPTSSDLDFTIFSTAPKPPDAGPEDREPEYPPWGAGRPSLSSLHGPLVAEQWQQVELPLADFVNPEQPVITGIAFQDDMHPDAVFYLDEISLILANQAPTDIRLDPATLPERTDGAVVGVVTISDPTPGDTHTLTVSDPRFEIVDSVLKLKSGYWLEFSSEPVVTLEITAEDSGGLRLTKQFVISVQAVTEWLPQRLDWLEQTYAAAPMVAASAAADRIAVVWEGVDAGGSTVFMQLFTAEGVAVTAPFLVPQHEGRFREPTVAVADDGSAYVAFVGQDDRVSAQRVGPAGERVGDTMVLEQVGRYRSNLFVSVGSGGRAAVCWQAVELDNSGLDVLFAFIDPASASVATYRTGQGTDQARPHVAVLRDGRAVGVWEHWQGQWFTRVALFSNEGSLETLWRPFENTSFGVATAVWADQDDNFLVYGSARSGTLGGAQWHDSQGNPYGELLAIARPRTMSATGRIVTNDGLLDRDGNLHGSVPHAAEYAFLDERLVTVDADVFQETLHTRVYSAELNEEHAFSPLPAGREVSRARTSPLATAVGPGGETAVIWRSGDPDTGQHRLALRTTNAAGTIVTESLLDVDSSTGLDIAFVDASTLVMVLRPTSTRLLLARYGIEGTLIGEPIELMSTWYRGSPIIRFVPDVGGVMAIRDSQALRVWNLNADAELTSLTPESLAEVSFVFDAAMGPEGRYMLLWGAEGASGTTDVFGQTFGPQHAPLAPPTRLLSASSVQDLRVAPLENGEFVALAQIFGQLTAIRLGPEANPRGESFAIDSERSLQLISAAPTRDGALGIIAKDRTTSELVAGTLLADDTLVEFLTWYEPPQGQTLGTFAASSLFETAAIVWSEELESTGRGHVMGMFDTLERFLPEQEISWQNPNNRFDVNDDGIVSPLDVLLLINRINHFGAGLLPPRTGDHTELPFFDVLGNRALTAEDVLAVINHINLGGSLAGVPGELRPSSETVVPISEVPFARRMREAHGNVVGPAPRVEPAVPNRFPDAGDDTVGLHRDIPAGNDDLLELPHSL